MTVLALDLGTTMGYAMRFPVDGGVIRSSFITFKARKTDGPGARYLKLIDWLEASQLYSPFSQVFYEDVRRHNGTDAAHVYGGLRATVQAFSEKRRIPYRGIPVGTIKKHATGKGNASKEMMIEAARKRGHPVTDHNEADALAILYCGLGL